MIDLDLSRVMGEQPPAKVEEWGADEGPPPLKVGDWIVCADDHRNWRFVRAPVPGGMVAADVVDLDGLHPAPGSPVAGCRECGGSLIVNGNQGLRFRVLRAAPADPAPLDLDRVRAGVAALDRPAPVFSPNDAGGNFDGGEA